MKLKYILSRANLKYMIFGLMVICVCFTSITTVVTAAGNLSKTSMRSSRMGQSREASVNDPILVVLEPLTVGTEVRVGVSFASGYTVGAASAITLTTTGIPSTYNGTSLVALPGIATPATAASGQNVTITCTDLTVGTAYAFLITGGITNPATTGQKITKISTHSSTSPDFTDYADAIDTGRVATIIVTDNGSTTIGDQIVVTAKVAPTYTFALSGQSITLDTNLASVQYPGASQNGSVSAITATVTTNAHNGHLIWLKAASASGLTSASTSSSIPFGGTAADGSPASLSAGTAGVVVDVDSTTNTSGSLAISDEFNGLTTSSGGTPSTSFQEIATAGGLADTPGDVVTIIPRVAIAAGTFPADDYTNTLTVIGASNF